MRNLPAKMYHKWLILLGCCFLCLHVHAQNWDINTLKSINPDNPDSKVWRATSASAYVLGFGLPVGMWVAGELTNSKGTELKAYEVAGSVIIVTIAAGGLKRIIQRQRPFAKYPGEVHPYKIEDDNRSMPSGHTSLAFATAASIAINYKKWYIAVPAYAWAASVGYSRLYLGAHYPTDVIAGAATGIGSAYLSHWLNKKLFGKRAAQPNL